MIRTAGVRSPAGPVAVGKRKAPALAARNHGGPTERQHAINVPTNHSQSRRMSPQLTATPDCVKPNQPRPRTAAATTPPPHTPAF